MAFQVIWSPTAKLDLADLATYIAEFDIVAGGNFVRSVFQAIERLGSQPLDALFGDVKGIIDA